MRENGTYFYLTDLFEIWRRDLLFQNNMRKYITIQ